MADRRTEAARAAIQALRRIRAVESGPDDGGLRTVWHQGQRGVELVSWVRTDGRVVRQEFTLVNDHFQWSSAHGLQTGEATHAPGSKAGPASGQVALDPGLVADRVYRAHQALEGWDGQDLYILHLKRTFARTVTGLESFGEATVTSARAPSAAAPPEAPRPARRPWTIAAAIGVLAVAGLTAWRIVGG